MKVQSQIMELKTKVYDRVWVPLPPAKLRIDSRTIKRVWMAQDR
jgi:hypothetical protein